ncbi:hypothetical protein CC86DRAFT_370284 [Ophiobolus disseminans]|uniref:Osmotin, thaumatin-like protein n=1 Tax=Ophiobolus disseminans TaxID=1469910 RepID=A0A6A6ZZB5_9PLEO|nr:hypothetical protein CC86DRAFT_370284 [Ophiobolus disseminans]
MQFKNIIFAAALQAGLAAAVGNAIISNRCPYDVYVFSVSQLINSAPIKVPARSQYKEQIKNCNGCNTSFKVSKTDKVVGGAHTQFEYTVAGNQLWYDISLVDCAKGEDGANCPGWDKGLAVDSTGSTCGKSACKGGSFCPAQVYFVDQPLIKQGVQEPVFTCPGAGLDVDVTYKLCNDEAPLKRSIAGRLLADIDA